MTNLKDSILIALEMQIVSTFHNRMILRNFLLLSVKREQMFLVILSFTNGICVRYHSQIVCKFALVAFLSEDNSEHKEPNQNQIE